MKKVQEKLRDIMKFEKEWSKRQIRRKRKK